MTGVQSCALPICWQISEHAGAFDILPAKAKKKTKCLGCHTTGYWEQDRWYRGMTPDDLRGVQCEACHGAGGVYRKPIVMSRQRHVADPKGRKKHKVSAGLKYSTIADCERCHNESCEFYKPLVIDKPLGEIIHPPPPHLERHLIDRFRRIGR